MKRRGGLSPKGDNSSFCADYGFLLQDITILRYALVAARGANEWNMVYHNVRFVI